MKSAAAPVSASEISKYKLCPRAWAARYRWDEWPDPAVGAQHFALGREYHKVVEAYLRSGTLPTDPADPLTELLMSALPHLPAPGVCTKLEQKEVFSHRGVPYEVTADGVGPGLVVDHKTSKDPRRYGVLTREAKLSDTQTVLYSFRYLMPDGGIFDHVYVQKHRAAVAKYEGVSGPKIQTYPSAPRAFGTPIHLHPHEIQEAMDHMVHPVAEKVYQLRRKHDRIDPLSLDGPPDPPPGEQPACLRYGGCPYIDRCWPGGYLGTPDTEPAATAVQGESLADVVRRHKASPAPVRPNDTVAEVVDDLEKILARLRGLM